MLPIAEPTDGRARPGPGSETRAGHGPGLHLLLVSCNPQWTAAVHAAAAEIDGSAVLACHARDALIRVASGECYSHLLIDSRYADGLLDALADLTSADASTGTSLLLLGAPENPRPHLGVISSANPNLVRRALAPDPLPSKIGLTDMPPTDLHDALTGTMIEARYQPIVRLADRRPVALEALARLNHPAHGTLLPDSFVPQFEGAGRARELTEIVSQRVFADLTDARCCGGSTGFIRGGLAVTLNFPLDVLLQPAALHRLEAQRAASGIPAAQVVVELTESRPVEDLPTLRRSLEHLRSLGYGVSIDDVSPAVPHLVQLLDMPFTCLKLDKDIVVRSEHDPATLAFLRRTVDSAQARGMTVVAEGIATPSLWTLMQTIGADEAQGFLVARPLPPAAVQIWLDAWQAGGGQSGGGQAGGGLRSGD